MERKVKASGEWSVLLGLLAGGLVLLNVLSAFFYTRWDLTERRMHSLSGGTKRLLGELEDTLTVRAYFTKDLPPPFNQHERAVRDILEEYRAESRGKLRYEIIHPGDDEELNEQAREDGVEKIPHAALKQDQAHEVLGYRGVAFLYRGDHQSIKILSRSADISGLEYEFTTTIRQVIGEKRTIGFVSGHGEPSIIPEPPPESPNEPRPEPGIEYLQKLAKNYRLSSYNLASRIADPEKIRGLVVVGPTEEFSPGDLYGLDQFLMKGGSLAFFVDGVRVEEEMSRIKTTKNTTGLGALLETYGARLNDDVVMDVQTDRYLLTKRVNTPLGPMPMSMPVPYPPWPHMTTDGIAEDHPVLFRLPGLTLLWPSTVRITREAADDEDIDAQVLVRTTSEAWNQRDNFALAPTQEESEWMSNREEAPSRGTFPLVVALEGMFDSHWRGQSPPERAPAFGEEEDGHEHLDESVAPGRILVVGDSDLVRPQYVGSQRRPQHTPSNVTFMMNALDWLAEDEDLIEVRAKRLEDPQLPEMTDSKRELMKWGNILAWPALFLLFGVVRWRMRRARRYLAWDSNRQMFVVKQRD